MSVCNELCLVSIEGAAERSASSFTETVTSLEWSASWSGNQLRKVQFSGTCAIKRATQYQAVFKITRPFLHPTSNALLCEGNPGEMNPKEV